MRNTTFTAYRYATAQDRPLPVSPRITLDTITDFSNRVVRLTLVADPRNGHDNERIHEHAVVSTEPVEGTPGLVHIAPSLSAPHEPVDLCTPDEILHITAADFPEPPPRTYTSRALYALSGRRATLVQAMPGQPLHLGILHTGVTVHMRGPDVGVLEIGTPTGRPYESAGATVTELSDLHFINTDQVAYALHLP